MWNRLVREPRQGVKSVEKGMEAAGSKVSQFKGMTGGMFGNSGSFMGRFVRSLFTGKK